MHVYQHVFPEHEHRMVNMLFNYPLLPYFAGFTAFTPEVPKLYWDVKSQEQRYFMLCKDLHKMICYANTLADRLNEITADFEQALSDFEEKVTQQLADQNEAITSQLAQQNEKVAQDLADMKTYIDYRFDTIAEGMNIYDVTTGTYRPSNETMRRLYTALAYSNTGERALVSEVAMQSVSDLAEQTTYHIAWSERDTIVIDDQVPTLEGTN